MKRLEEVFAEVFRLNVAQVDDSLTPEHVRGWDSLGHLRLVTVLEESFGVAFEGDDVMEMESVGKIREILAKRGAAG
jgi:acyl carrier protein